MFRVRLLPCLPRLFSWKCLAAGFMDSPTASAGGPPMPQRQLPAWLPTSLESRFEAYKKKLFTEYRQLTEEITSKHTRVSKEAAARWQELRPIVDVLEELDVLLQTDDDMERFVKEVAGEDEAAEDRELFEVIQQENHQRGLHRRALEEKLLSLMVPVEEEFHSPGAQLELVAGAGGREAGLFARELLAMYSGLAGQRGWQFTVTQTHSMSGEEAGSAGDDVAPLSKVTAKVTDSEASASGAGVYGQLIWEAGVHRVQRVPVTSRQHRIHTSTVAVSVLPLTEETGVTLLDRDMKWAYFRASGAGGQHVNRTDSAVRLTHLPTGTVVTCQQERDQLANKRTAIRMLLEKLNSEQSRIQYQALDAARRSHLGHLDRSEKIRTYNFQQDRVTDHRLGRSWSGLERFMQQTVGLSEAIEALFRQNREKKLGVMLEEYANCS